MILKAMCRKIYKNIKQKKIGTKSTLSAFTLVELIIVIAIISVLSVSAMMLLTKWLDNTRDARRISDLGTIQKGLEIYYTDIDGGNGKYPEVDGLYTTLYSGSIDLGNELLYQGFVTEKISNAASIQKKIIDPDGESLYTYSVTKKGNKFQIGAMLEDYTSTSLGVGAIFSPVEVYALDQDYTDRVLYVIGSGLGIVVELDTNLPIQYTDLGGSGLVLDDIPENYIVIKDNTQIYLTGDDVMTNLLEELGETSSLEELGEPSSGLDSGVSFTFGDENNQSYVCDLCY